MQLGYALTNILIFLTQMTQSCVVLNAKIFKQRLLGEEKVQLWGKKNMIDLYVYSTTIWSRESMCSKYVRINFGNEFNINLGQCTL